MQLFVMRLTNLASNIEKTQKSFPKYERNWIISLLASYVNHVPLFEQILPCLNCSYEETNIYIYILIIETQR